MPRSGHEPVWIILRLVGGSIHGHLLYLSPAVVYGPRWHRVRAVERRALGRTRRPPHPPASQPGTFILQSAQVPGAEDRAGRKWKRLVGLEGRRDAVRLAVCGLWVDGLYSDLRPAVSPWRACARLDGARRQRNERGPDRAPATGPMASCASIDIEDATQHLRDILKLDRPAGGETGQCGWALAKRAEGQLMPGSPSGHADPCEPALHPPSWRGQTRVRVVNA